MRPRLNSSLPPAFHEPGEYNFQELCQAVFAEEESVTTCDIYGIRGQKQRGIDLLARRRDGDGNEVAQCKCHQDLTASQIAKASDDFFAHLDYWKERDVKRFVLIAACPLDSTQQQEAIQQQIARFKEQSITYEAWSTGTLRRKLAPHREIAERHIKSQEVVENICGAAAGRSDLATTGRGLALVNEAVGSQFLQLSSALSREKAERVEDVRALMRAGRCKTAYARLQTLHEDTAWSYLEKPLRARILRVLASCALDVDNDVVKARQLVDEAKALDPSARDTVIRAAIKYREDGPSAALDSLTSVEDADSLNFQLDLLLEKGSLDECLRILTTHRAQIAPNADTLRMHALVLITKNDLSGARKLVERALAEQPEWESVRMAAAIVWYYSALSAAVLPDAISSFPAPVPWEFVKRDDESRAFLRRAEASFQELATNLERPADWRRVFSVWRLACLANDPGRQEQVSDLCRSLLADEPGDPRTLSWALARGYEIDLAGAQRALAASLITAPHPTDSIGILVGLHLTLGKPADAIDLLERTKDEFARMGLLDRWRFWRVQALAANGATADALNEADSAVDTGDRRILVQLVLEAIFAQTGKPEPLLKHLETSYRETGQPRYLYAACNLKARLKDWAYVSDRAEELVQVVGTAAAVHLAAGSLWETRRPAACLKLLNEQARAFPNGMLPRELWRLRIYCMQRVGLISGAVFDADLLNRQERTTESLLALIDSQVLCGDLKGVAIVGRQLLRQSDAPACELLRVARLLGSEDPDLARALWRRAAEFGVTEPTEITAAVGIGYTLGLDAEVRPF